MRRIFGSLLALTLLITAVPLGAVTTAGASTPQQKSDQFKHIFYIMMENHATNQIFGNTADAPFLNKLARKYAVSRNYYGVTHPSLPNYLAAISGNFQGIWDDCKAGADVKCAPEEFGPDASYTNKEELLTKTEITLATNQPHLFTGRTLIDQLESHGINWKAYMQSAPVTGFTGEYFPVSQVNGKSVPRKLYAQKHNPFMYFSSIRSNAERMKKIVPFTHFDQDIQSSHVPNFVWISPDQCNDMHGLSSANAMAVGIPDCGYPKSGLDHSIIKMGDDFLSATVTQIMASPAWKEKSAIIIVWDEDDYAGFKGCCHSPKGVNGVTLGGANAPFMTITSKSARHFIESETPYNHYTLLATIEKLWGLPCLENACGFKEKELMTKFFA